MLPSLLGKSDLSVAQCFCIHSTDILHLPCSRPALERLPPDSIVSLFQVFSSKESSDEEPPQPFPQPSSAKGGRQVRRGPWPALKSRQSVAALNSAALVASRTRAFQEQGEAGCASTPRHQKIVRQASVDSSGEEGEA